MVTAEARVQPERNGWRWSLTSNTFTLRFLHIHLDGKFIWKVYFRIPTDIYSLQQFTSVALLNQTTSGFQACICFATIIRCTLNTMQLNSLTWTLFAAPVNTQAQSSLISRRAGKRWVKQTCWIILRRWPAPHLSGKWLHNSLKIHTVMTWVCVNTLLHLATAFGLSIKQ